MKAELRRLRIFGGLAWRQQIHDERREARLGSRRATYAIRLVVEMIPIAIGDNHQAARVFAERESCAKIDRRDRNLHREAVALICVWHRRHVIPLFSLLIGRTVTDYRQGGVPADPEKSGIGGIRCRGPVGQAAFT